MHGFGGQGGGQQGVGQQLSAISSAANPQVIVIIDTGISHFFKSFIGLLHGKKFILTSKTN
jgi:hypothetical protein